MASPFAFTPWGGLRGLPPATYWYEEEEFGGKCQLGVRHNVPFLAPGCEFQTGPTCCEGTVPYVSCQQSDEDGLSYGHVYCLP